MDTRRLISPFVVCLLWSASLTIELTVSQIDVQNVTTDGGLVDDASLWDLITSAAGTSLSPQADVRLNDSTSISSPDNDVSFNETLSNTNSWSASNDATDVTFSNGSDSYDAEQTALVNRSDEVTSSESDVVNITSTIKLTDATHRKNTLLKLSTQSLENATSTSTPSTPTDGAVASSSRELVSGRPRQPYIDVHVEMPTPASPVEPCPSGCRCTAPPSAKRRHYWHRLLTQYRMRKMIYGYRPDGYGFKSDVIRRSSHRGREMICVGLKDIPDYVPNGRLHIFREKLSNYE